MRLFLGFFCALILWGCNQTSEPVEETPSKYDTMTDTIADIEETVVEVETVESTPALVSLLENPLDLAAFKAEYGPSNSGSVNDKWALYPFIIYTPAI